MPSPRLKLTDITTQAVTLRARGLVAELRVLAPDLFRLRMTRGKKFSPRPSWAVIKTDWPAVPTRIRTSERTISLATPLGKLTFRNDTAQWKLTNARGELLLSATSTQFKQAQPHLTLALRAGEAIHGLGETTGPLDKRGLVREFWNADVLGHASAMHPGLRNLYVSIPFAITRHAGRAAGIFWDNPARQIWDLGQTVLDEWRMNAASGELDLYLFVGPSVPEIVTRYTELTGRIPLPPRWALGYHQCRYSYESRAELERIAREFRRRHLPCEALYLDIHHMDGHRVFTFGKNFPRPAEMLAKLARQGFKVVAIVDPGVKNDAKFGVLRRGRALKAFVQAPSGKKDFLGKVWPGECRFPDFANTRTRQWWGAEQARFQKLGIAGFWNDMNEPALFDTPNKSFPEDAVHHTDDGPLPHAIIHNVYGSLMAEASREGALAHAPHERPFVITRAGYAGVQRYATVWTGDNSSTWEHLAESVPMLLNLSLSGVAFCGADAGGFLESATGELLARWMQLAALTPFFRNHSNLASRPQEPWAFGPEIEKICRRYLELRVRLLPYLEELFAEAHAHGTPIMRPLFWHYPDDAIAARLGDQFLLGENLLVAPVLQPGLVARCVYLPPGEWINFWNRDEHYPGGQHIIAKAPLDTLPLYLKAGVELHI